MRKFSFIIPVYNCEIYIENCVKCLKEVKLKNYEIILVDDGSCDNSGSICDALVQKNPEIQCFHQKNQGVSAARNKGMQVAKGEYIIFIDADDSIEPNKMEELLAFVESNPQVDMFLYGISFDYYFHGKCYRQDNLSYPISGFMNSEGWISEFERLYEANALSPIWNKVYRRDILERNNIIFNEKMFLYEDLEFSIRYMAYCDIIYNSSECIYHYRQTEDEGNSGRRLKRINHLSELVNQIEDALDDLIEVKKINSQEIQIKNILLTLYLVLAREKISVSNIREIQMICEEFIKWSKSRTLKISEHNQLFVKRLGKQKVYSLQLRQYYIKFRHKVAVRFKNSKLYQIKDGIRKNNGVLL